MKGRDEMVVGRVVLFLSVFYSVCFHLALAENPLAPINENISCTYSGEFMEVVRTSDGSVSVVGTVSGGLVTLKKSIPGSGFVTLKVCDDGIQNNISSSSGTWYDLQSVTGNGIEKEKDGTAEAICIAPGGTVSFTAKLDPASVNPSDNPVWSIFPETDPDLPEGAENPTLTNGVGKTTSVTFDNKIQGKNYLVAATVGETSISMEIKILGVDLYGIYPEKNEESLAYPIFLNDDFEKRVSGNASNRPDAAPLYDYEQGSGDTQIIGKGNDRADEFGFLSVSPKNIPEGKTADYSFSYGGCIRLYSGNELIVQGQKYSLSQISSLTMEGISVGETTVVVTMTLDNGVSVTDTVKIKVVRFNIANADIAVDDNQEAFDKGKLILQKSTPPDPTPGGGTGGTPGTAAPPQMPRHLYQIKMDKPEVSSGTVNLIVTSGLKLWENAEGTTEVSGSYSVADLPKDFWVEGVTASSSFLDQKITISTTLLGDSYSGKAGSINPSGTYAEDELRYTVINFDLLIDTNYDDSIDDNDRITEKRKRVVSFNYSDDGDDDGIPDFADGFTALGQSGDNIDTSSFKRLVPIKVEMPLNFSQKDKFAVGFEYTESPLAIATPDTVTVAGETVLYYKKPTGGLRIWKRNASSRNKDSVLAAATPGDFIPSSKSDMAKIIPLDKLSDSTFYVEVAGEATSESVAQIRTVLYMNTAASGASPAWTPASGISSASVYAMAVSPFKFDFNRDGSIDDNDYIDKPWRFWINDDKDSAAQDTGYSDSDTNDRPGNGSDGTDSKVNTSRDLVDFFPVYIDLNSIKANFSNVTSVKLKHSNGAFNYLYVPSLDSTTTMDYLRLLSESKKYATTSVTRVTSSGSEITESGIYLLEARSVTSNPLVLEITTDKGTATLETLIETSSVTEMFGEHSVRPNAPQARSVSKKTGKQPYQMKDNTVLVWVHGYYTSLENAQANVSEVFKNTFWSGYNGSLYGFMWPGDPASSLFIPSYHEAVKVAFQKASEFKTFMNTLQYTTRNVSGHSLGNMLVSSAIVDHGLSVNQYFAVNAAVAAEAYSTAIPLDSRMTTGDLYSWWNPKSFNWSHYKPETYSANWSQLFPSSDGRNKLTWKGRFSGISPIVNYYSSGEDILAPYDNNNIYFDGTGGLGPSDRYSWVKQEKFKGVSYIIPTLVGASSDTCGWAPNEETVKSLAGALEIAGLFNEWASHVKTKLEEPASPYSCAGNFGTEYTSYAVWLASAVAPSYNDFEARVQAFKNILNNEKNTNANLTDAQKTTLGYALDALDSFLEIDDTFLATKWIALYGNILKVKNSDPSDYWKMEVSNILSNATIKGMFQKYPFFYLKPFELRGGATASQYATDNRNDLLATAIPALSQAAGFQSVSGVTSENMNYDSALGTQGLMTDSGSWPSKYPDNMNGVPVWKHSDYKFAPYQHTYKFYDKLAGKP